MPYPNVTPLPTAPSRISKPIAFDTDSSLFLNALPTFRTQTTALNTYIFNAKPNAWNFGSIEEIDQPIPSFKTANKLPQLGQDSTIFVSDVDILLSDMKAYSDTLNVIGEWVDDLTSKQEVVSAYSGKLSINNLPTAPTSSQDKVAFNSTTTSFLTTYVTHTTSMSNALNQMNNDCRRNDDYGLITDNNITTSSDSGLITDNTYIN